MTLRQDEDVYGNRFMVSLRAYFWKSGIVAADDYQSAHSELLRKCLLAICLVIFVFHDAALHSSSAASCSNLKRQLASLENHRGGGGGGGAERYRDAARSQSEQISKVRDKLGSYGCSSSKKLFKREAHPSCGGLRSTLRKMKGNLRALKRKADRLSGGGGNKRQQRALKRAIKRNNCDGRDIREAKAGRTSIIEQIFGDSASQSRRQQAAEDRAELERIRKRQSNNDNSEDDGPSTEQILKNYNTVRTVCVRRCDGYYFPVSFSTTKGRIEEDAQACSNLCPGTQMDMYFHKTQGESPEEMISLADGTPYSNMPNAFAYRENYDPDCSCNYRLLARKQQESVEKPLTAEEFIERQRAEIARMALPAWRIDRGQDPETIANISGGLDDEVFKRLNPANKDQQVVEARRVRVIGDAYLPTQ